MFKVSTLGKSFVVAWLSQTEEDIVATTVTTHFTDYFGDAVLIADEPAPEVSNDQILYGHPIDGFDDEYYVQRRYAKANLDSEPTAGSYGTNGITVQSNHAPLPAANLVTSLLATASITNGNDIMNHAPAFDIDIPCELIESSQIGHYHMYIHKAMTWNNYVKILKALADAGVVEQGYYAAAVNRGYSSLRLRGNVKPGIKTTVKGILRQLTLKKTEVYLLKNRLRKALARIEELEAQQKNG